jgi:hypothetical protein
MHNQGSRAQVFCSVNKRKTEVTPPFEQDSHPANLSWLLQQRLLQRLLLPIFLESRKLLPQQQKTPVEILSH